jgi:hypothetical protein
MAIPKVSWKGNLYESYGDIHEQVIIEPEKQRAFDLRVKELDKTGDKYIIYIDLYGNIEKVEKI